MSTLNRRETVESAILKLCRSEFLSLGQIAESLDMNKNTLRSIYLYPMVKSGKLLRSTELPFKSTSRYKANRSKN